jgi:hypothetical protein
MLSHALVISWICSNGHQTTTSRQFSRSMYKHMTFCIRKQSRSTRASYVPGAKRSEADVLNITCAYPDSLLPIFNFVQANVDPRKPFEEWELEKLANKMRQYCPLLEDMTGASLEQVTLVADAACRLSPSLISKRTE